MSIQLSAADAEQFDTEVKHEYQAVGLLRPTVRNKRVVGANTHHFRVMGKGSAKQRTAPQTDVVPMDVTHTKVPVVLEDWDASEYTDIFNDAGTNFDERMELAHTIASALGRREDQLIIDALDDSTPTSTVAAGGTNVTVAKLRETKKDLDDLSVPGSDRTFIMSADAQESLLGETEVTSSDFNSVKALVSGEVDTFLGFKFIMLGARDEGGLTIDGSNIRSNYAYHRMSVGLAMNLEPSTSVDWVPQKKSWLSSGHIKANAVVIDADGVVEVLGDET